jgi:hypothetical protein
MMRLNITIDFADEVMQNSGDLKREIKNFAQYTGRFSLADSELFIGNRMKDENGVVVGSWSLSRFDDTVSIIFTPNESNV